MITTFTHISLKTLSALVMAVLFTSIYAQSSYAQINVQEIQSADNGQAVVNVTKVFNKHGKSARVEGAIKIKAAPKDIWAILIDCKRGPTFLPGLKKCEMLEISPDKNWDIRRHTNKISSLIPKTISEFKNEYAYPDRITFSRTGGDLKALNGTWTMRASDDKTHTILSYQADMTVKSALPDSMLRKASRKRLGKVLELICIEVETDIAMKTSTATLTGAH